MNILSYGAGALGQALGCMLAADGHHIDLILRPRFIRQITENGLQMNKVIDETFAVITALGGHLPWPDPETYRKLFYDTLVPATSNHRPSMLQDLENGKPTEVDALVGYVSAQSKRLHLPSPVCDLLTALVKFKEAQGLGGAGRQ